MTFLNIVRDSGYADRLRAYQVILDGMRIGEIRNGETRQFVATPGKHNISLKIDWCGSRELECTAAAGEQLTFEARSNLRGLKLMAALWYVIFDRNSYLLLERRF